MTPLQTAAQALLDAINPQGWHKAEMLRKALEAEQAQAVEPKLPELFSEIEWLGNELRVPVFQRRADQTPLKVNSCTHPAPPPAGEQIDWQDMYLKQKSEKEAMAAKYEKDIGPLARVSPAMHISEILAEKGITLQKTFVEKPRDHVGDATAMVGRIEFIQKLRDRIAYLHEIGVNDTPVLLEEAADMLEADAPFAPDWAGYRQASKMVRLMRSK